MPHIRKETARPGEQGEGVRLTVVTPDSAPRGSIVVLHRSHAFSPAMLDFMRALADERWLVVVPDLGGAEGGTALFGRNLEAAADATFRWIEASGIARDTVGLLGFDDAGASAMYVASERVVGAVVSVSPPGIVRSARSELPALIDMVGSLRAPWLGLYGDDDPKTPPGEVDALRDAAGKADAPTLVVSYAGLAHRPDEPPVRHASVDPESDPAEAAVIDARQRIFDWFDSHLR